MRLILAQLLPLLPDRPSLPKAQWRVVTLQSEPGLLYYLHPNGSRRLIKSQVLALQSLAQVRTVKQPGLGAWGSRAPQCNWVMRPVAAPSDAACALDPCAHAVTARAGTQYVGELCRWPLCTF